MRDLSLKIIPLLRQQHDDYQHQANHFFAMAEEFAANPPVALAPAATGAGAAAAVAAAAAAAAAGAPAGAAAGGAGAGDDDADSVAAVSARKCCLWCFSCCVFNCVFSIQTGWFFRERNFLKEVSKSRKQTFETIFYPWFYL